MNARAKQRLLEYLETAGKLPRLEAVEPLPELDDFEDDAVELEAIEPEPAEQPSRSDFVKALRSSRY